MGSGTRPGHPAARIFCLSVTVAYRQGSEGHHKELQLKTSGDSLRNMKMHEYGNLVLLPTVVTSPGSPEGTDYGRSNEC